MSYLEIVLSKQIQKFKTKVFFWEGQVEKSGFGNQCLTVVVKFTINHISRSHKKLYSLIKQILPPPRPQLPALAQQTLV